MTVSLLSVSVNARRARVLSREQMSLAMDCMLQRILARTLNHEVTLVLEVSEDQEGVGLTLRLGRLLSLDELKHVRRTLDIQWGEFCVAAGLLQPDYYCTHISLLGPDGEPLN